MHVGYCICVKHAAVICGHPPNPNPHSSVQVDATTLGSVATYTCDHGYDLVGTTAIECLYTKEWSDVAPVCKRKYLLCAYDTPYTLYIMHAAVDCGPLPAPENGDVKHVPHTLLHSLAKFSCNKGFELVGHEVLKCEYDGEYSDSPPVCKRKYSNINRHAPV